jgi:peptidoglycan/LPS O-acetylase OafA/YrhL
VIPGLRADIEGLRAFAVLAVILNHAFPQILPGGFAGVDIFFVISGYLIGSHLIQGFGAGTLTFAEFYRRRVRRIAPALVTVLLVVWIGASMIQTGPEFASLGRHMASAALFSNNLLLASETGYFDAPALSKPLLHLWSLGVEEQFYLVAPLLLWLGARRHGPAVAWFARLGALSLLWIVAFADLTSAASFYFLHSRFWELAAGVCLAHFSVATLPGSQASPGERRPAVRREILAWLFVTAFLCILLLCSYDRPTTVDRVLSQAAVVLLLLLAILAMHLVGNRTRPFAFGRWGRAAPALGMGLLACSILLLSPTEWPGPKTLIPVIGTLLVLVVQSKGVIARLLSSRPAVAVGQISYPLYLWHWPLLVGWRLLFPNPAWYELLLPVSAAFLLAWVTTRLVEDPVRFGRLGSRLVSRPTLWPISGALALVGLAGLATVNGNGLPQRFPLGVRAMADWSEPRVPELWRLGECYHNLDNKSDFAASCTPPKRPDVPLMLLWGDSHAGHLYPGLKSASAQRGFDVAQWTTGSCPPTLKPLLREGPACDAKRVSAWNALKTYTPDTVLLSAAWGRYLEAGNRHEDIVSSIRETIHQLRVLGVRNILLFGPSPVWDNPLPAELFRHMVRHRLDGVPERFGQPSPALWNLDNALSQEAFNLDVVYFSALNALCDSAGCLTAVHRQWVRPDLLFWDREHLTPAGSQFLVGKAGAALADALDDEKPAN